MTKSFGSRTSTRQHPFWHGKKVKISNRIVSWSLTIRDFQALLPGSPGLSLSCQVNILCATQNSKPKTETWKVDPKFNNSEQTWEALCDHLNRNRIFTLAFYNSCISTPILKTWNDNLCDSQLLIGWDNSQGDPLAKTVCGVESAHIRAIYLLCHDILDFDVQKPCVFVMYSSMAFQGFTGAWRSLIDT